METKKGMQIIPVVPNLTETVIPSTGREAPMSVERRWESFPQPAGWAVNWDNEGLLYADLPDPTAEQD